MARERHLYRENLEILNQRFPDKDMLNASDVKQVFGFKTYDSVRKYFPMTSCGGTICKSALAEIMCGK